MDIEALADNDNNNDKPVSCRISDIPVDNNGYRKQHTRKKHEIGRKKKQNRAKVPFKAVEEQREERERDKAPVARPIPQESTGSTDRDSMMGSDNKDEEFTVK